MTAVDHAFSSAILALWKRAIQTLERYWKAAIVDDRDRNFPLVPLGLGARRGHDGSRIPCCQSGLIAHPEIIWLPHKR
jgi:hypothetical protein